MKIMSKMNITNPGKSELPKGSAMVSDPPIPKGTIGNTSGVGV